MYIVMERNKEQSTSVVTEVATTIIKIITPESPKKEKTPEVFGPFLYWDEAEKFIKSHEYYLENFMIIEVKSPRSI